MLSRLGAVVENVPGKFDSFCMDRTYKYCLLALQSDPDVTSTVSMLMQARAVPGGQHFTLHGEASTNGILRNTLDRLEAIGFVECFESRNGFSHWNLAPAALKEVLPVLQFCNPETLLKTRINLPLKDRTAFELLSIMNSEGWTWQRRHPKQVAPPYDVADRKPKVFYTSGIGFPEVYGRCLLDADRRGAQGVTHIEH